MRILVTGAGGFIGRHVVRELESTEHDSVTTSRSNVPPSDSIRHVPCDLNRERDDWFEMFGHPDSLIHLAWEGLPHYGELFHIERNLWSNYRFLKRMVFSGVRSVTVIGTCFEYGLREGCLSEELLPSPCTAYGIAKNSLRVFLEELRKTISFDWKWVRIFYPDRDGRNSRSLLGQLKAALDRGDETFDLSGGEQLRDYLPVETVAKNIVRIATQDEIGGIVNNCSGTPISVRKLVEDFVSTSGQRIRLNFGHYPYPDYEPFAFWGDTRKLSQIVSNSPDEPGILFPQS